jgi:hypothetical protein
MYAYFPMNYTEFDDGELLHFAAQRDFLDPEARKSLEHEIEIRGLSLPSAQGVFPQADALTRKLEISWYS